MFFEWNEKIQLGVIRMDEEHKTLIAFMNALHSLNETNAGKDRVLAKFDELIRYAGKHFADEEAYMKEIAYAKLQNHSYIHRQLMENLQDYRDHFSANAATQLPKELFLLLKGWLTSHILGIDRQYAAGGASAHTGAESL
ncbi:MAG: hemerythrin family protein [Turneriella sp.]|nr:hemerythrin family protein [Turneriella sp.]